MAKNAKKKQKSNITKIQLKKLFNDNKIRECKVNVIRLTLTNSAELRQALLRENGIRDCVVRLNKMTENDIRKMAPKKILQLAPKIVPVRFNVSWISTPSSTKENSAEALSALEVYRHQNGVVQSLAGTKNVKRQRAKSMFVERSHSQSVKFSMDDMHHEFTARYNSPNRGLKSNADRQLAEAQPQPLSDCQKIYNELKARLLAKRAPVPPPLPPNQQQKLSWNELKALVPKQFPVVQGYVKPRPTFEWPMVVEMKGSAFYKMNEAMKKVIENIGKR